MDAVHHFSRDSARTPMQWTADANAGFTAGRPWLPTNENYETVNADSEEQDPDSVLSWYRELAALRSSCRDLTEGSYEEILIGSEQIYGFVRKGSSSEFIVLMNFSEEDAEYDPALVAGAELLISSAGDSRPNVLAPLESAIYERK